MALPANIRVNVNLPFPAFVLGSGPITIAKVNGIWTIGFSIANLGTATPSTAQQATDYVIVWDSIAQTFVKVSLSFLASAAAGSGRTQRLITTSANLPLVATDSILNLNSAAPLTIQLPAYAGRLGAPLTFKDVGGQAGANNITFTTTGGDKMDNFTSGNVKMTQNYQAITFIPANDGTSTGWSIE